MSEGDAVGLCLGCRWVHVVRSRRGSTFYRCGRADTDPTFPRYPPLPVLECRGYDPTAGATAGREEPGNQH